MNDLDRWINLEGPPPDDVRELLDAAFDVRSPEEEARAERRIFAAVEADRRRWRRRQIATRVLGGAIVAACLAGAVVLGFKLAPRLPADASMRITSHLAGVESTSATAVPAGSGAAPAARAPR